MILLVDVRELLSETDNLRKYSSDLKRKLLPETKFDDGIKLTISWYLENKPWGKILSAVNIRNTIARCMITGDFI